MYFIYILRSAKDNGYYFGHTADLNKRLQEHNKGTVRSTKSRIPFTIQYYEAVETESEAFKREMFFKSFEGRKWLIEQQIISSR